jgi:hypothetical protein
MMSVRSIEEIFGRLTGLCIESLSIKFVFFEPLVYNQNHFNWSNNTEDIKTKFKISILSYEHGYYFYLFNKHLFYKKLI